MDNVFAEGTWAEGLFAPGVWPFFAGLGIVSGLTVVKVNADVYVIRVVP